MENHSRNSDAILRRLHRIEGQIKGICLMVEDDRSCVDIITQLSAVNAAVTSVAREVLNGHIEHCVVEGIKNGDEGNTVKRLEQAVNCFAKLK